MDTTIKNAASKGQRRFISGSALPPIHKQLKAMVQEAAYDLEKLMRLKKQVDPIMADQITVIYWDCIENFWPDYELDRKTGKVITKFSKAFPPSHKAIRFNGNEKDVLVRIIVKNVTVETIYNVIAPAILKAGIKPFLIFNNNTFLILPKDRMKVREVIERVA